MNFTDISSNGASTITSLAWNFGDGATSTSQNPSHTYTVPGIYDVKLKVTNGVGPDSTTKSSYITAAVVPVPPTADFSGTPTSGLATLNVTFTDLSTAGTSPITSRLWNFGDGSTSTATNPSHDYTLPGDYTVVLSVHALDGSEDNEDKAAYIQVSSSAVAPTAAFSAIPVKGGPPPINVQFTDASIAGTSPITARLWDFGDGSTSTGTSPSHSFSTLGTYTVTLGVMTADGSDTEIKAAYVDVCQPPAAALSGTPTTGFAPLDVQFTDGSTPSGITSWAWDFGDGTTSLVANPLHTFDVAGTYPVKLKVTNACSEDSVLQMNYVTVTDSCPTPTYSVANARWDTITDTDHNGYSSRARLVWNADQSSECPKSVFAKVYYRGLGDTDYTLFGESACYTITGNNAGDTRAMFIQDLPLACYEFRIDLFECGGSSLVATLDAVGDGDLSNQCFEPTDATSSPELSGTTP